MDHERVARWVTASHGLGQIEPHMVVAAQDLGWLDVDLLEMDAAVHADPSQDIWLKYHKRFGLSRLWVLGSYELVRCIDQRFRPADGGKGSVIYDQTLALKREFERLRMPLA